MDAEFRTHVLREIDAIKEQQERHGAQLEELLAILRASKFGANALKWLAAIVAGVAATFAIFHSGGAK